MASLGDLLRENGDLSKEDIDHLQSLVADWALLADLSFADLLLLLPIPDSEEFVVVAQVRPATGPTAYLNDEVGSVLMDRWVVRTAWKDGRIVREGEPEWVERNVPVRTEAIPVRRAGRAIAVLARDTNLASPRSPSPLELAYLESAGDLAQMIAEGTFPFRAVAPIALPEVPRVGDGMIRVDGGGRVAFASPNALSAYRRLGYTGNVTGEDLRTVHVTLDLATANPGVWQALQLRRPVEDELSTEGTVVLLRAIPLFPGTNRGVLILVRDVSEVRRREAQLLSKDATIREIHHRVKNNLTTVAALLRLQARRTRVPEARIALGESVRRVTSIALVHETLSQALDESVAFDKIADEVTQMTVDIASTGARPTVVRDGSFGELPGPVATPLALVLSELLHNAVEHAFDGSGGEIQVRVTQEDGTITMIIADDGAGLPADFAPEHSTRLGLQIVRALVVGEMRGTFALRPGPTAGTEAVVMFPRSPGELPGR